MAPHNPEREALLPRTANSADHVYTQQQPDGTGPKPRNPPSPWTSNVQRYLNADIDTNWTSLILLIYFFTTGLIDSGSYNAYRCFTSMQTGNTIFAALGISDLPAQDPPLSYTKSLAAICSFLLGSLFFATFHRRLGLRKRWTLFTASLVQALMILTASLLIYNENASDVGDPPSSLSWRLQHGARTTGLPNDPGFPWADLIPIGLLSFQAAGKVITSRMVEQNGLPVVVLTTMYADLLSDPALFTAGLMGSAMRNKRILAVGLYFAGAVVGGTVAHSEIGFAGGLGISALIQVILAMGWLGWWEDAGSENQD